MSSSVIGSVTLPAPAGAATPYIERGTPDFLRISIALFCAGIATFTLLYCVQPMLPVFSRDFGISAAQASLAISLPSIALAFGTLVASALSESFGRKPLMVGSVFASAGLTFVSALAPNWEVFLLLRTLQGLALAGLPAAAIAYLAEEVHPRSIGLATGLYISGNALGGMAGRVGAGVLTEFVSWHVALAGMGLLGLLTAVVFVMALRQSRHFKPRELRLGSLVQGFVTHLREPGLRMLFIAGVLMMGGFVTMYNYIGYRLMSPEIGLSPGLAGMVYSVYLVGIVASASIGSLADRLGRARIFWMNIVVILVGLGLSLLPSVFGAVAGLALLTLGFFGAHAIANAWVGRRALQAKAQAASLYLFACYGGSGVLGTVGGWVLSGWGWAGVVGLIATCMVAALALGLRLSRLKPLAQPVG
ncbi:MFS transporter [Neoroseomonas lacus]|uniref:MFS transporter n=1 Tax=Neoroseomonas lacus TaxID=287609 RepID=A0A917KG68_9PROT|nr:MFS transporter [Neoroseomonas lacus]GGJ10096.1 MFS transporter [Neoroseomonas lacus]